MAAMGGTGATGEWRAHWHVILPCITGIMLCAAHGYSLGVMIGPLEREFGWARAEISTGYLIIAVIALLVSPLSGAASDRFGPRKIGLFGILFYCSALALLSTASGDVVTWWGLWVLLGIANMTVLPVIWLSVVNGYFFRSRGLAMAVCLSGTGFAAALIPILTDTLVEWQGWRGAYIGLGAIAAAICFPMAFFLFHPAKAAVPAAGAASTLGLRLPSARGQMRSARFYKLAGASFIFAVASCALTTNAVPVLIGEGLDPTFAAATAGLLGIGSIIGRLCGGFLLDRMNGNKVAAVSVMVPVIAVGILLATSGSQLWAGVAIFVLGLAVGTELDACAYLTARHFGTRNFGALFGTINGLLLFGAGMAPLAANLVYDRMRSYDPVLIGLVPLFVVTAALFLMLGPYPELDEDDVGPVPVPIPLPGSSPAAA